MPPQNALIAAACAAPRFFAFATTTARAASGFTEIPVSGDGPGEPERAFGPAGIADRFWQKFAKASPQGTAVVETAMIDSAVVSDAGFTASVETHAAAVSAAAPRLSLAIGFTGVGASCLRAQTVRRGTSARCRAMASTPAC